MLHQEERHLALESHLPGPHQSRVVQKPRCPPLPPRTSCIFMAPIDESDVYKRSRNFCPGVSQYILLEDYFLSIFPISKVTSFTLFLPKGGKRVSLLQHHADPAAHLLGARPGLAFLGDCGGSWSERPRAVLSLSHPRTGA